MLTLSMLEGTRSWRVDLAGAPFLSSLGPNEGELELELDAEARVRDLRIHMVSARRNLLRELDRLAASTDWDVPIAAIRSSPAPRFVVALRLSQEASERLKAVNLSAEGVPLEDLLRQLRPLLKESHFRLENVLETHDPR